MRILLVEDDPLLAECIRAMLHAHVVHRAGTFVAAADALTNLPQMDFVLSDIRFPGRFVTDPDEPHGFEVAELCKDLGKPFLLMTGDDELFDEAIARGYCILRKPFRMDALLDILDRVTVGVEG